VRERIVGVSELVDEVGTAVLGDGRAEILVVLGMALADVRAGQHDLGAHRTQVEDLLLAHLVGQDEDQLVALLRRHQRETDAGVARRRLDDRVAGRDVAALLGFLDHRDTDTILDGAARIDQLEFQEQAARPGVEAREFEHRGAPDHVENTRINVHGR
jgi:hypothetical protein